MIIVVKFFYGCMFWFKVLEGCIDVDIGEFLLYEGKSDEVKIYFL